MPEAEMRMKVKHGEVLQESATCSTFKTEN